MKQEELKILLEVSAAVAAVKNKGDLFEVIVEKIKPVFNPTGHAAIVVIDEEQTCHQFFLSIMAEMDEREMKELMKKKLPVDPVNKLVLDADGPIILQLPPFWEKYPDILGTQLAKKLGITETMACPLWTGGKKIGSFHLHSTQEGYFTREQFPLFKTVADMVAAAVSNIITNEEKDIRQYQNKLLTEISAAIATVRNKDDLFHVILEKINPVFDCKEEALVLVINEAAGYYQLMLMQSSLPGEDIEFYKTNKFPIDDYLKQMLEMEEAWLFPTAPYVAMNKNGAGAQVVTKLGVQEIMTCRLMASGKKIGCFSLLADKINHFNSDQLPLFKAIADIVAVAVSNILANEEKELREIQKSKLLQISSAIATVRDKNDLFRLLAKDLKSFIQFDDAVIALIDEPKQILSVFLADVCDSTKNHPAYIKSKTKLFPIQSGGFLNLLKNAEKPVIVDVEQFHQQKPDLEFIRFAYNFGMKEAMMTKLTHSGRIIGMFSLLSKQRHQYITDDINSLHALSSLVAIALNNILSNQEILDKEQHTQRLYNISTNIANVRDKKDLFHLIAEDVKKFISFDNAIISTVDENLETFGMFLSDIDFGISQHRDFDMLNSKRFPLVKDSIPYQVIHSDKPRIIDIKKEHFRNPEVEFLKFSYDFGMRESLVTKLSHLGKPIGIFILFSKEAGRFSERDITSLQSLSSLITIALRNILAIKEIETLSRQLEQDNTYLNEEIKSNYNFEEIIGVSKPLQEVFQKVTQVAHAESTVLITGETGTGKELIARAIHNLSPRKTRPLIKVNCAALPATLIESELFGHEKGSFTGATDKRIGKFELANGSTIFLDEIGELPLELQAKLLRAIQEKEIERLGGEKIIKVDVRIIAATNRILEKEVSAGKFRQDLFYRLNVYPIELPPLRERKEDIPLLAAHFIQRFSKKLGRKITSISPSAMEELVSNQWPGNIRELEHTMERSMLLTQGRTITTFNINKTELAQPAVAVARGFEPKSLGENEKELIIQTLKYTKGRIRGKGCAAELLHILPTTLEARMKKLGIKKEFVKE